ECQRLKACPANTAYLFQPHSSDDDQVHSVTIQDASYARLGCLAYRVGGKRFLFYATSVGYALDECHVDKSGRWLMILGRKRHEANNRVIDRRTEKAATVLDTQGSLGHLDMGFGYAVGADNYNSLPNATILLRFPVTSTDRPVGAVVHFHKRWDIAAGNHVTHANAVSAPPNGQYACGSNASRVPEMADEIVCFSLNPLRNADGTLDVLVVAPVMTDLDAPGGGSPGDDYVRMPKGNLDVTGEYFIWTTNLGGDRLDAFLVKVPSHFLTDAAAPATTSVQSKARH